MRTNELLAALNSDLEAPWATHGGTAGLTARALSQILREFDIRAQKFRHDGDQIRGYRAVDFADAWDRYLPTHPKTPVTTALPPHRPRFPSSATIPARDTRPDGRPAPPAPTVPPAPPPPTTRSSQMTRPKRPTRPNPPHTHQEKGHMGRMGRQIRHAPDWAASSPSVTNGEVTVAPVIGLLGGEQHRLLYRVEDACRLLSLSRSRVFELLRAGDIRSVTQGRTRLIPYSALLDYVAELEESAS